MSWLAADMEEVRVRVKVRRKRRREIMGARLTRSHSLNRSRSLRFEKENEWENEKDYRDSSGQRFLVVPAAHRDVAVVAADLDLRAFLHAQAIRPDAKVHGGLAAAVADGFHVNQVVSRRQH